MMTEGDLPALPACISCPRVPHAPVSRDAAVFFGTPLHKSHSWMLGGPRSPVDGPSRRLRSPWQAQQPQQGLAAWRLARTTFDTPNRLMPETSLLSCWDTSAAVAPLSMQWPKDAKPSKLQKRIRHRFLTSVRRASAAKTIVVVVEAAVLPWE